MERRVLVAIGGGDASGKTTYAARLVDALRSIGRETLVIHVDASCTSVLPGRVRGPLP